MTYFSGQKKHRNHTIPQIIFSGIKHAADYFQGSSIGLLQCPNAFLENRGDGIKILVFIVFHLTEAKQSKAILCSVPLKGRG